MAVPLTDAWRQRLDVKILGGILLLVWLTAFYQADCAKVIQRFERYKRHNVQGGMWRPAANCTDELAPDYGLAVAMAAWLGVLAQRLVACLRTRWSLTTHTKTVLHVGLVVLVLTILGQFWGDKGIGRGEHFAMTAGLTFLYAHGLDWGHRVAMIILSMGAGLVGLVILSGLHLLPLMGTCVVWMAFLAAVVGFYRKLYGGLLFERTRPNLPRGRSTSFEAMVEQMAEKLGAQGVLAHGAEQDEEESHGASAASGLFTAFVPESMIVNKRSNDVSNGYVPSSGKSVLKLEFQQPTAVVDEDHCRSRGCWTLSGTRRVVDGRGGLHVIEQGLRVVSTGQSYWLERKDIHSVLVLGQWTADDKFEGEWLSSTGARGTYRCERSNQVDEESSLVVESMPDEDTLEPETNPPPRKEPTIRESDLETPLVSTADNS